MKGDLTENERIAIPEGAARLIALLTSSGFEAYAVGGCVRDALLGREPNDWDITTSALPGQVVSILSASGIRVIADSGLKHGTVTAILKDGKSAEGYEITTFRTEGTYSDGRHPDEVTFVRDLASDLCRRDLTINAMAANDGEIVDPFGGRRDLELGIIRAVGDPEKRFREDALRILRAARFAAQLGFEIEENTLAAMRSLAPLAAKVSAERRRDELDKLLAGRYCVSVVERLCDVLGVSLGVPGAAESFPEAARESLPTDDEDVMFALYFGDRSPQAAEALKLSNRRQKAIRAMVEMRRSGVPASREDVLRSMRRYGDDAERALFYCSLSGDARASTTAGLVRRYREDGECFELSSLAITGGDLVSLGLCGEEIGAALEAALEAVICRRAKNERNSLIQYLIHHPEI